MANSIDVLPTALLILLVPGIGGAWEEPGWRGYALPRLLNRRSPVGASLLLGVLWSGWHVPLLFSGQIHLAELVEIVLASVVFTWLFTGAGRSVLIAMAFHAMNNAVSGGFFSPMFTGGDSTRQAWLLALVWCLAAVIVVIVVPWMRGLIRSPRD